MNIENYLKELKENGFVLIPDLISDSDCDRYKALLEADYENYSKYYVKGNNDKSGDLSDKSGEKVVFNLHNKNLFWFKLFEHPNILPLLDHMLKAGSYRDEEPYYLNNISARCPLKGYPAQQLHIDSNLPGTNYCNIAYVLWLIDDFTLENGATKVVPGSHKWTAFAPDGVRHKDEISITGSKGSAIVFNANLWHGSAANTTDQTRWAVALGYARWFIKPSFDFMQNTPEDIFCNLTDQQKSLLGFQLVPPKDEFTRLRRRSSHFENPLEYHLPKVNKC
jgi:ectoine hydroxylase-related dioxygenase (phytanoyl-CoA dioxygenase family)